MDADFKGERPPHPRSNIIEILTFWWTIKIFNTGRKRDLEVNDLYSVLDDHSSSSLGIELEKKWKIQIARAKKANVKPSLLKALLHMFGPSLLFYGFIIFISEIILRMIQPMCIGYVVSYFDSTTTDSYTAIIAAVVLILSTLASTVGLHQHLFGQCVIGYKMRIAITTIVYSKVLRLSKSALCDTTGGQLINLLSNDVNRFDTASLFLHFLWAGPLKTIVATYFLWQEVGISSIFGVVAMLAFVPLQGWLGKKSSDYRQKTATRTDARVRLMNEIISGIQVIKMYTWEKPFAYLVQLARKQEILQIKRATYIKSVLLSFAMFNTRIAFFACILSYTLIGNNVITAQKMFVITSYYNILKTTMTVFFPQGIGQLAELLISIERLRTFLLLEEKNDQGDDGGGDDAVTKPTVTINSHDSGIQISGATAKWIDGQPDNSLENINLTVKPGQLVAVIGRVGAGKSSLLQVILRELPLSEGSITVRGVLSYASQEPWLFAGSVQQNILFGLSMDKERYKKVIKACALKTDFDHFPRGDKTIVGDRGVLLSGGQKARINLARAVYKQADIYLLDDPLSAVDTNVGKHIFEKCIKGYLKEKTCILITHQLQHLTKVDQVVLLENAKILAKGSYQELQTSGLDFMKIFDSSTESTDNESTSKCPSTDNLEPPNDLSRQDSIKSASSLVDDTKVVRSREALIEVPETCLSGDVSYAVYSSYFSAGGNICKLSFVLLMCILTQVLASCGDYWIMLWIDSNEHSFGSTNRVEYNSTTSTTANNDTFVELLWWSISRQTYIIGFTVLMISMVLVTLIRSFALISVCMKASVNLHNKMFNAITRTTMYFFNTNSSGRILNRFSKDIGVIDDILPSIMVDCIQIGLTLVGILIVVGLVNVYLMLLTVVVAIIFYKVRVFYLATSRSVKRLEGVTRSPLFAHLNASLRGITTIRAYEAEQILCRELNNHQDLHSSAWYLFLSSSRAFGFWLDLICIVYISIIIFSLLVFNIDIIGCEVGLVITQVIGLTDSLQWGMRQSAELENQMISVERVLEYANSLHEPNLESSTGKKSPKKWPQKGQITFKNFYLRYNHNLPHVLKNLNFSIKSMEKIGIVGRTGAGKSSLINALFRLAHNEGSIIIDNIDINDMKLYNLRSKISIIPQEPVLFSGTLRKNLDPFDTYSDHCLWNALNEVQLKSTIEDLPDGLNSKISESGSNLSVGQRQLVCLARAILQNNKILVLDEATANVDLQTDALIQNTIRNKFRMCTVLTIAHRLNTIMDSDKVLVIDAGTMVEFDHPFNLLKNKDGFLYNMVEKTGQVTADLLHGIAEESYNKIMPMIRESPIKSIDDVDDDTNIRLQDN